MKSPLPCTRHRVIQNGRYWKAGPQGETHAASSGVKWGPARIELLSNDCYSCHTI